MRTIFFLFGLILIGKLQAQTSIPAGSVSGNWQKSGSPYKVNGHIYIPAGQKLTITEGVIVEFQGDYKMDVWGVIQAIGKANDTVVFTAKNKTNGWTGLWVHKQASSNDSILFDHCKFEFRGLQTIGSVPAMGSALSMDTARKVRISNCKFTKNRSFNAPAGNFRYCAIRIYRCILIGNESSNKDANIAFAPTSGFQFFRCNSNVSNCSFINNNSYKLLSGPFIAGGALTFADSTTNINNCLFKNNGPLDGNTGSSGLFIQGVVKNSIIQNCTFSKNWEGIVHMDAAGYLIKRCNFDSCVESIHINNSGNQLPNSGSTFNFDSLTIASGGYFYILNNRNGNPMNGKITNTRIFNSKGIHVRSEVDNVDFTNCIISNNLIGLNLIESNVSFYNSSILNSQPNKTNPTSDSIGSGIQLSDLCKATLFNSIISGNKSANGVIKSINVEYETVPCELQLTNCILEGGKSSITNVKSGVITKYNNVIVVAPQFVNPTSGAGIAFDASMADWRPVNSCSALSNTFNAGINSISGFTFPAKDLDGNSRKTNGLVDIGPYEIQKPKIPVVIIDPRDTGICANTTMDYFGLMAVADSIQYRWQNSANGTTWSNIPSQNLSILFNYKPKVEGIEYLRCIVTNPICSKSDTTKTISVTAKTVPKPNLGSDVILPSNGSKLLNPGTFSAYLWSTTATTPTLMVDKNNLLVGANSISVLVTGSNGCKASDTVIITLEPGIGLQNTSALGVKIYPIPAGDVLNIDIPVSVTTGFYQLHSLDGRILLKGSLRPNHQLNLSELATGTYMLSLELDGVVYGVKVVK